MLLTSRRPKINRMALDEQEMRPRPLLVLGMEASAEIHPAAPNGTPATFRPSPQPVKPPERPHAKSPIKKLLIDLDPELYRPDLYKQLPNLDPDLK